MTTELRYLEEHDAVAITLKGLGDDLCRLSVEANEEGKRRHGSSTLEAREQEKRHDLPGVSHCRS